MANDVKSGERISSWVRSQTQGMQSHIDEYLMSAMPDLISKHKLATEDQLTDVDEQMKSAEGRVGDLEDWRKKTETRVSNITNGVERLETKYGLGV